MRRTLWIVGALLLLWSAGFALFMRHLHSFAPPLSSSDEAIVEIRGSGSDRDPRVKPEGDRVGEMHCEAVVVFTGKGRRIQAGYDLFRRSGARGFLVSGVEEGLNLEDLAIKETSNDAVTLGYKAYNTHTNAIETALWVKKNEFKSLCLVTGLYHMPRSLLELQPCLPHVLIYPYAVNPPKSWWQDRQQLIYVLSEYHKFCFTHLIQWIVE